MSEPREIAFEDIKKGDDIEARYTRDGMAYARRGVAHHRNPRYWYTEEGGALASSVDGDWTHHLHHRPTPTEPKGLGAVVRARTRSGSREGQFVHIRAELGAERWQGPGGGIYYWSDFDPESIEVLSEGIEVES